MAETAGSLRLAIQRRIRDPDGTAHAAADIFTILTAAQRLVNVKTRAVLQTTAVTAIARTPLYYLNDEPLVVSVQVGTKELQHIEWQTLAHYDPYWFRRVASFPTVWSTIGRTVLLVWPASPVQVTSAFTLVTVATTAALTQDADVTELPDQHMPAVLDIAEQCLLARQRLFGSIKQVTEKQAGRVDGGRAT